MTITQGPKADERLISACRRLLKANGIEPFGDRHLHWLMPPELVEHYMSPDLESRMLGYPVHMEVLLGEQTVVLVESIASTQVE